MAAAGVAMRLAAFLACVLAAGCQSAQHERPPLPAPPAAQAEWEAYPAPRPPRESRAGEPWRGASTWSHPRMAVARAPGNPAVVRAPLPGSADSAGSAGMPAAPERRRDAGPGSGPDPAWLSAHAGDDAGAFLRAAREAAAEGSASLDEAESGLAIRFMRTGAPGRCTAVEAVRMSPGGTLPVISRTSFEACGGRGPSGGGL